MALYRRQNVFIRYSLPITVLVAVAAILCGAFRLDVRLNADPRTLLEGDAAALSSFSLVEDALQQSAVVLISMTCSDVFDRAHLDAMQRIGDTFLAEEGVTDVKSFTHSVLPYRNGLSLEFRPYIPRPWTPQKLAEARDFSVRHPLVRNILVSTDARNAIIAVTYRPGYFREDAERDGLAEKISEILKPHEKAGRTFASISVPQVQSDLAATAGRDITRFCVLAGLFVFAGCAFYFRTLRMISYVGIMLVLYGLLLQFLAGVSGKVLSPLNLAFLPMLLAIELMMLAHLCRMFHRALADGLPPDLALGQAVGETRTSCLFAAVTTASGLLSLAFTGYRQSADLGVLGSIAVIAGWLFTFGPGVSLLRVMHTGVGRSGMARPFGRRLADGAVGAVGRLRLRVAGVAMLLMVLFAVTGFARLKTDVRITRMLPRDGYSRQAAEFFENTYGGKTFLRLVIDTGREGGVVSPQILQYMLDTQRFAETLEGVSGTYSYASVIAMVNEVWSGWAPGSFRLPGPMLVLMFDSLLRMQNFPFTDSLFDTSRREANLYVRTTDMPSEAYLSLVNAVRARAEATLPEGASLVLDPGLHSILDADRRMLGAQARSAGITLAVMLAVLLLLWRSLPLALLSMASVCLPVSLALGAAGWMGIPLNSVTTMFCAIALGIAVDDVVHFITYWRRCAGSGTERLLHTMRAKGPPIVFTSVLLLGVFGILGLSAFPPVSQFGLLSVAAYFLTLGTVLFGLPAVLMLAGRRRSA